MYMTFTENIFVSLDTTLVHHVALYTTALDNVTKQFGD